jgi:hypothetical protein
MMIPRLALALLLVGCLSSPDDIDGDEVEAQDLTGLSPVTSAGIADPGVVLYGHTFYAFSTGAGLTETTAPTAGGPWTTPRNTMVYAGRPAWIDTSAGTWAPDMIRVANGQYVVYFAAGLNHSAGTPSGSDAPAANARCIGSARASSPVGPFTVDARPVVCLHGYGASDDMTADPGNRMRGQGVIDPSPAQVTISGAEELFLVYKTQGPAPSTIRMVRLSNQDGSTVLGDSHQLLESTGHTQADTLEGPSLVQNGSWFVLFVAHGNYATCGYSTQWYKSQHIWAWSNAPTALLTSANTGLCGPGGADVTDSLVAGQHRIFFHGWVGSKREMYAAVLTFASDGYTPRVAPL